jgi:hypothetical protein
MAKLKLSLLSWSVVKKMTIGIECHEMRQMKTFLLLVDLMFQQYFSYIMATSFSGGRSRREPPTMGKQLVNFITCGCESSAPFL